MSLIGGTKLDPSLNFHNVTSTKSKPLYRKVYPANGGSRSMTLSSSGAIQQFLFNIPAECVNMGESYLEYQYTIDAQAGGQYSWIYKDVHGEFDNILYRDTGSMNIVEVRNAHLYQQLTNRLNFSDEYLKYNDGINGLVRTNAPLADVKSVRFDGNPCSVPFIEPQQMALISPAGTISSTVYKKIYLKDLLKDTYFGMAKNQILPIETYLELNLSNASGRVGYSSTSAVAPNAGLLAFIGNINISNMQLNLCVEQNQDLIKMLKAEVEKGYSIPIPWVRVHQLSTPAASQSYVYNLPLDNKQHGQRLKRIVYAPIVLNAGGVAAGVNQLYDHQNLNATPRIQQYQTELDNQKLQRDIVMVNNTDRKDDYMFHKDLLKDTLYFNQGVYAQNWVHVDTWDYKDRQDEKAGHIMVDGLLLEKPMNWSFNCFQCGNGADVQFSNVTCVLGQKQLAINSSSFVVA